MISAVTHSYCRRYWPRRRSYKRRRTEQGKKKTKEPGELEGLRKNSPRLQISTTFDCCKKKCLRGFTSPTLEQVQKNLYYDQQNIHLIRREETKETSGHSRKDNQSHMERE